ncbi:MAG: PIN domain-containing protein [Candidatus Omnitrophica bacterium]|nr:PIN domain-containing protein [Candidatus Omnitrophota bacterium]
MKIFVDTSALYASLAPEDAQHDAARQALQRLAEDEAELVTTNYVLLECASLIQRRHGFAPAKAFLAKAGETLDTVWIDAPLQQAAITIWTRAQSRQLSLVDCTSFAAMRHAGLRRAFAFDVHFTQHGFSLIP